MKHTIKIVLVLLFVSFFAGCSKDNEKDVTPTPSSPSDPRNVFIGNWLCNENPQIFPQTTYPVTIYAHTSIANRIVMSNFYNMGVQNNCQMEVSGNSITIFQQNVSGYDVLGSGTLVNNSTINLSYITDDGSGIDHVTAVYTKTN